MNEFLQKTGDWISDTFTSVTEELSSEGAHNYLWAIPGGILGFMFTQNMVGSWFGGGMIAQIAAIPLSLTAAMAGAVWASRGVNIAYDWATKYFDEVTSDGKAKAEPEVVAAPVPEVPEVPEAAKARQEAQEAAVAVVSAASASACLNGGNALVYDVKGADIVARLPFKDVNEESQLGACVTLGDVDALAARGVSFKVLTPSSRGVQ